MRNGVTRMRNGKFRADIIRGMKSKHLGVFETMRQAEDAMYICHLAARIKSKGQPYTKKK